MRVCWNRQTGTFEGRVSSTYEFKSRHSHQKPSTDRSVAFLFCFPVFLPLKKGLPVESLFYCSYRLSSFKPIRLRM